MMYFFRKFSLLNMEFLMFKDLFSRHLKKIFCRSNAFLWSAIFSCRNHSPFFVNIPSRGNIGKAVLL